LSIFAVCFIDFMLWLNFVCANLYIKNEWVQKGGEVVNSAGVDRDITETESRTQGSLQE
jgi:hypothetical protein